jgi:hypothetical protein
MELGHYGRYECRHCHALWDDDDRNSAVRAGKWRDRETGLELLARIAEAISNFQEATGLRVSAVSPQFIDVRGLADSGPRPILAGVEVELVL